MLKTLIAGVAAIGLITAGAPQKASAGDGGDFVTGVIAGVFLLGTLAAIDNAYDDRHRHSHSHVRVKPKYGHHSHNVYRHGTRIYSNRDNRHRHDDYGYRHRDHYDYKHSGKRHHGHKHSGKRHDGYKHSGKRHDDRYGHRHKHGHGHAKVRDDHDAGYRHKGGKGAKHAGHRVHDRGGLRNDRPRQRDAQRIRDERRRLAAKDSRLQAQIDARTAYARSLNPGWDQ